MVVEGQLISDGTAVWKVKKIGSEVPAGTMQMFAGNTIPAGWLLCDGSAVSRTDYAKLFSAIGTIYGEGDGSTTFALPNLVGRFVEGAATAGTYKAAGLPNITGDIGTIGNNGSITGAFEVKGEGGLILNENGEPSIQCDFNASRCSNIYGSSNTVQPPAIAVTMWKRIA